MKDRFSYFFRWLMLCMVVLALQTGAVLAESSIRLSGHVPKAVSDAAYLKKMDASTVVPLTFTLPLRNKEELEELIQRIHNPSDEEMYGKYLTSEEFAERFAPTQDDYDHLVAYAKSLGLTVTATHSNRLLLNASGQAESLEAAFNLHFHHYQKSSGRTFYAPDNDPEIPSAVASIIHGIVGLDNHAVWGTYNRQNKTTAKATLSDSASHGHPSGPGGGYSPSDISAAYNLVGTPANGSGQIIALFELGGYLASDITAYTSYFNLPSPKLKNILVDGGSTSGIDPEVTLDIELAIALAPESEIYVYEGPNSDQGVLDTYNQIAKDNSAKQVSTSWGLGESLVNSQYLQAENAIFQQMAAQGQTIYAAAGDAGAYDEYPSRTLVVDDPASQPYVVGVGGTRLTVYATNGAYGSESVWNNGSGQGAGGGGVSKVWPIPSWQAKVPTLYSKTHRNVPDVALNADPTTGYSIYYNGQWTTYGGTSCAAPLWAAFTACVNQERLGNQKPALGFANPLLYAIGMGSSYSTNFHDITQGNNLHYSAKKGYDNASGWGSFIGGNLFATLTNSASPSNQLLPDLRVTMTHKMPFSKGGTGAYKIVVHNRGHASTSDTVTMTITLPKGLTCKALSGLGWTLDGATLTCTQNSALHPDSSYPSVTLIVDVDPDAPESVSPTVTVSGGGTADHKTTTTVTKIY